MSSNPDHSHPNDSDPTRSDQHQSNFEDHRPSSAAERNPEASVSTERKKSSPVAHGIRILLLLLLLGGSLWFALRDVEWSALWGAIGRADLLWVFGVALFVMIAHLARAWRWRLLITDGKEIGLMNAFSATVIGYFMSNIIPRSGEFVRPYTLAKREGRSTSSLLATVVVERVMDGLTLLIILAGILFLASSELARLLNDIEQLRGYTPTDLIVQLAIPVGLLVLFLILIVATRVGDRVVDLVARILPERIGSKIHALFDEFRAGARFSGGARGVLGLLFWTIVIWGFYALSLHAGVIAFGFDTEYGLDFGATIVILGITTIGMAIAPTPGGFGIFHSFCRATLVSLYGIPVEQAVAFAFVTHFAQYAAAMIAGIFFSLREGVSLSTAREEKSRG